MPEKSEIQCYNGGIPMQRNRFPLGAMESLAMGLIWFGTWMSTSQAQQPNTRIYELRTYTTLPGRLPALNKRFADYTIQLFAKHGMRSEMYWTPTSEALKDTTLIYLISHENQEAVDKDWKEFEADPEWIKVRNASEADGKILAKPPERVFMTSTDYSPRK
jgi:hypothetical protein